ncbi:MAG: hypothetical protein OSA40_00885 [Phycisphaerales bacterium]|nr:hypothetical protein [Phycisphaerales bacterium]
MLFLGHFEHTIDTKNRLAIPAELRDVFDEATHGTAFVAAPGATGNLWLWPERTFAELASELGGSLLGDEDQIDFERVIFSQSARCPIDSAGRIRLPDRLLTRYGLSGSVMVMGVRDHLEVILPEDWRREQASLPSERDVWRRARQARTARSETEGGR